ncbi:MAG: hypothetical protein LUI12_02025 [Clostridiales bacterium]|nr:hypothetical protein [Clostridiales bacterium]
MFNSNSMPFTIPLTTEGGSGNGNNGAWGDGGWWVLIILFALIFGWGGNGWGNNGGGGTTTNSYYTDSAVQRGFDTQSIQTKLDGLTNGLCQQGYQNQQGFHDVDNAVCTLGYQVQQGFNDTNTTMLQGFNSTNMSLMQGQNALATQLANCCCEEREAIQGVNYNLATQACNIQNTMNNNTRDILEGQNAGFRSILDYLCQQKIEDLQSENQSLKLAASQSAQNSYIASLSNAQTNELIQRINPMPVPAFSVPAPYPYATLGCGCNSCGC